MARNTPFPVLFCMQFYAQLNNPSFALMFHTVAVFSSFVPQQFDTPFSTYFARVQFMFYFNQSIAFIIPVLITFAQLKYQGNGENKSPFATHPITMHISVCSLVLYYLAHIALLRFPLRHRVAFVAYHCLVWFGYILVATLSSVLFPASFSPFIYAIFAFLSAIELLYWLYHKLVAEEDDLEFHVQRRRIHRFLNCICRAVRNSSRPRRHLLPF